MPVQGIAEKLPQSISSDRCVSIKLKATGSVLVTDHDPDDMSEVARLGLTLASEGFAASKTFEHPATRRALPFTKRITLPKAPFRVHAMLDQVAKTEEPGSFGSDPVSPLKVGLVQIMARCGQWLARPHPPPTSTAQCPTVYHGGMCGAHVTGQMSWAEIFAILQGFLDAAGRIDPEAQDPDQGFNIRPTQTVRIATLINDALELTSARWWFVPRHFKGPLSDWKATTFNARIETVREKPTFAGAWTTGRCILPALGYYEWTGSKADKQPWFIAPEMNEPLMWFAGLHSVRPDGLRTCTILTRPALPQIAHLHSRSPVMLSGGDARTWLAGGDVDDATFGTGFEGRMRSHKVRPLRPGDDGEDLIEPFDPPEQLGFAL
ncbi:MAG: SOS response-associated peptidase [Pseudomonadota bacterium]